VTSPPVAQQNKDREAEDDQDGHWPQRTVEKQHAEDDKRAEYEEAEEDVPRQADDLNDNDERAFENLKRCCQNTSHGFGE
jgi:hypothetical protein